MSKGIRVKGKLTIGDTEFPVKTNGEDCSFELPPVRPEELKAGGMVLVPAKVLRHWNNGSGERVEISIINTAICDIVTLEQIAAIVSGEVKKEKSCENCDFFYPTHGISQPSHCHNGHKCENFSLYQPKESPQPKEEQPIPACHPNLHLPPQANVFGYERCLRCGNWFKGKEEMPDFGGLKIHESPSGAFCESEMSRWEKHNKLVDLMESLYKRK